MNKAYKHRLLFFGRSAMKPFPQLYCLKTQGQQICQ